MKDHTIVMPTEVLLLEVVTFLCMLFFEPGIYFIIKTRTLILKMSPRTKKLDIPFWRRPPFPD